MLTPSRMKSLRENHGLAFLLVNLKKKKKLFNKIICELYYDLFSKTH